MPTSPRDQPDATRDGRDPGAVHEDVEEFTIARSKALVPLLAIFAISVLATVLGVVRVGPMALPAGAPADHAFGPADFPQLFAQARDVDLPEAPDGGGRAAFPVAAPPFSDGIFPCSGCHESPADPRRRTLTMHEDVVFEHDAEHRWCLDCHDSADRDRLRLASGALIPFTESYRLCGQCHGTQFRDWRSGIHGKRTGYWNGPKRYLLCVHCHDPHSPRFKPLKPLPPPVRPQFLRAGRPTGGDAERSVAHVDQESPHGDAR